jgi:hypothetical protein
MVAKSPRVIWRGNPASKYHQPDPVEIVEFLDGIDARSASNAIGNAENSRQIEDLSARTTAVEAVAVSGARPRESVALATTANITLSSEQTIDGTQTSGTAVLVRVQSAPAQNGVYITGAGAWTRRSDMDAAGEIQRSSVYVNGGTVNGGSTFYTGSEVTTLGTDPIVWTRMADQSGLKKQIDGLDDQIAALHSPTAVPMPYTGQVSTRCRVSEGADASNKQAMARTYHIARDKLTSIQIIVPGWYVNPTTGLETALSADLTVTAAIEYPEGVYTQLKFGGASAGTVTAGGNLISDAASVPIPDGAKFFVRLFVTTAGNLPLAIKSIDRAGGDAVEFAASGLSDVTMGGTITTHPATTASISPMAIIGATTRPSVLIVGDRDQSGELDATYSATGDAGYVAKSISATHSYINASGAIEKPTTFAARFVKRMGLAAYCSHVIVGMTAQDLTGGTPSFETVLAAFQSVWKTFSDIGKVVSQTTAMPFATSTDAWATIINQTPNATAKPRIATFNETVRGGVPGVRVFDVAEVVSAGGLWLPGMTSQAALVTTTAHAVISEATVVRLTALRMARDADVLAAVRRDVAVTPKSLQAKVNSLEYKIFRVRDFGAFPYDAYIYAMAPGTVDSTVAIQAAIDAANVAGGGIIHFDPGFYKVSGPLKKQTWSGQKYHSQIYIPYRTTSAKKQQIEFYCPHSAVGGPYQGASFNGLQGAVLCSTITDGAYDPEYFRPSVIGGPTFATPTISSSIFNDWHVKVDGVAINLPDNPTLSGFDFQGMASVHMLDFRVETNTRISDTAHPTSPHAWGVCLPKTNNNVRTMIGNGSVHGCYVGVGFAEHTNMYGTLLLYKCVVGLAPILPLNHTAVFSGHLNPEWCNYIFAPCKEDTGVGGTHTGVCIMSVANLSIENATVGSVWETVKHIYDPENRLRGEVVFGQVKPNVGPVYDPLEIEGGVNLRTVCLGSAP